MSMTMTVDCPQCGVALLVPEEAAGRRARCKECEARFTIPSASDLLDQTIGNWLIASAEEEEKQDIEREEKQKAEQKKEQERREQARREARKAAQVGERARTAESNGEGDPNASQTLVGTLAIGMEEAANKFANAPASGSTDQRTCRMMRWGPPSRMSRPTPASSALSRPGRTSWSARCRWKACGSRSTRTG